MIVVVVATGAICAGSGHFWGNSSIYYSLQFMVEQLVREPDQSLMKKKSTGISGRKKEKKVCVGCRDKERQAEVSMTMTRW